MKTKKNINLALLCLAVLTHSVVKAQNYTTDMEKIRENYKNTFQSFGMKYIYYPFDSINRATDSMTGTCTISGNSYYYNVSNGSNTYEYIKNEKYYLVIDNPNKAIAVNSSSKVRQDLWNIDRVDSLLKTPGIKVVYKQLGKRKGQYEVSYKEEAAWKRLRIVFDKVNYSLSEIWLYSEAKGKIQGTSYNKPKVGILYSAYRGPLPDKSIFSEKKFIDDGGKDIVLTGAYKKYKLLNYLNQVKKS